MLAWRRAATGRGIWAEMPTTARPFAFGDDLDADGREMLLAALLRRRPGAMESLEGGPID